MSEAREMPKGTEMSVGQTDPHDRRAFFRRAGGASVLTAGVLAAGSAASASEPTHSVSTAALRSAAERAGGPVSFYVRDAATGELGVLTGEREVVVTDPALLNQLLTAVIR